MPIVVTQGATFEATTFPGVFDTGLAGTIGVRIDDNEDNTVTARTTFGITEYPAGSSIYVTSSLVAPAALGQYTITWDDGADNWATEELLVTTAAAAVAPLPPAPAPVVSGADTGPCSAWVSAEYVLESCSAAESTDTTIFEPWVTLASDLLFRLSGRQFPGECALTVRPCGRTDLCGIWLDDVRPACGCRLVSRVHLPDYPVREITEVVIDGTVVDPATYALRELRYLDRLGDLTWPRCQNMQRASGEEDTWTVSYTWGSPIPATGVQAAAELACDMYTGSIGGECKLPAGVTQLTRQGVTMSQKLFAAWGLQNGQWATGLNAVDAFLQTVNPNGLPGPTTVWSPDLPPFPRPEYA